MLEKARLMLRLTTHAFDGELTDLIAAAKADLSIADVVTDDPDELVQRAILTYVKLHHAQLTDGEYDRLKQSYDEQKAQLQTSWDHNGRGEA